MTTPDSKKTGRLAARFRRFSVLAFLLALVIMAAVTTAAFGRIISTISSDYAERYAVSSANSLGTHISKEVSLLSAAASSGAVIDWLLAEGDIQKKDRAYSELSNIISALYSNSLYIVPSESLREYKVEGDYPYGGMTLVDTLSADDETDRWFFDALKSQSDYNLAVAVDEVAYGKRVWVDYKVTLDGVTIGVIATGLEFPHIAGELFAHFDQNTTHGVVINKEGIVYIDSSLLGDDAFLRNEYTTSYETVYSEPVLTAAIARWLDGIDGYFGSAGDYSFSGSMRENSPAEIIELAPRPYRYATIAPVSNTDWLAIIIHDSSSLLDIPLFLPAAICALAVLIAFAATVGIVSQRLIFSPLAKLRRSLMQLKENNEENIYGSGREDEIGELSGVIRDWFTKANYDALTGIYNRRFMENNLHSIMGVLSRTGGGIAILMMDVDFFKKYNDTYGHDQGDACLRSVAQAIASCAKRSGDFAARYGGEEFVLVLPNDGREGACTVAEKVLESVRKLKLPHESSSAAEFVTVSIGVTSGKADYSQSWEEHLKRADDALYASKESGRNRYTYLAGPDG